MIPADKVETMLEALSQAVEQGNITKEQARKFRAEVGITNSHFTKKQLSEDKRKAKRKAQKAKRKANR
jgi:hypothetical protein